MKLTGDTKEFKLFLEENEEFNQWLAGNVGECWVLDDKVFDSKYINEVEPVGEISDEVFLVKMGGKYCRLSYM